MASVIPALNATFKQMSNAAFNNVLFSAGTICRMALKRDVQHPSIVRLHEAAGSLRPPVVGGSAVADWLNVSPQRVTNWGRRGVSREGALAAQELSGYSANWILTGVGEKLAQEAPRPAAAPPTGAKKGEFIEALSTEERELVAHFRHLLGSDRRTKIEEIAALARQREEQRREMFAEAGIDKIMERAAHATRRQTVSASVDPADPRLKQRALPLDGGDE